MLVKTMAVVLSFLTVVTTAPFTFAEMGTMPLGTITTQGIVKVGKTSAPSGTTLFAGDRVTSSQPALIDFGNGSRVEMTKAEATFAREGQTLVIKADSGLLRFDFAENENVRIETDGYEVTSESISGNFGEIGMDLNGQMIVELGKGAFTVLDKNTGKISRAVAGNPLVLRTQSGEGLVTKNGSSLTDNSKIYKSNELKGMCVVGGSEAYPILGNSPSQIAIKGSWKLQSGYHKYTIVECNQEAMMNAGASESAAKAAAGNAVKGLPSTFPTTAVALAGAAAGAGVGIGVWQANKSPSSR